MTANNMGPLPFGWVDVPVGGYVPSAPSYLCTDGKERIAGWVDVFASHYSDERTMLCPLIPHDSVLGMFTGHNTDRGFDPGPWNRY